MLNLLLRISTDREITNAGGRRRRDGRGRSRGRDYQPILELLEVRITPSTDIWVGADSNSNNWTDPLNWVGDVAPVANDELVFPAVADNFDAVNNFPSGTTFNSISVAVSGYTLSGNAVNLTQGISTTYSSGTTIDDIDTDLVNGAVSIGSGGEFDLDGVVSGSSGLTVSGGGTLVLGGSAAETYTGTTTVDDGTLQLSDTGDVAVPGDLVVGDGTDPATVQLGASDQINDTAAVTVNAGGELLVEGPINLTPSALTISGTGVNDAGVLVLDGNVNVQPSSSFLLDSDATIGVPIGSSQVQTPIDDNGDGYGVTLVGGGTLSFTAWNMYSGTTDVTDGTLLLDDTYGPALSGPLTIDASVSGDALVEDDAASQLSAFSADVTLIGSGAEFDLNGFNGIVKSLTFTGGTVFTGDGTLLLGFGGVTVNAAATTANILGNLDFATGTRTFTVAQGTDPSGVDLLDPGDSQRRRPQQGRPGHNGALGANTYASGTTISGGVLSISNAGALSSGLVNITKSSQLALDLNGDNTVSNTLELDSSNQPSLENLGGDNTLSGSITIGEATDNGNPLVAHIDTASNTTLTLSSAVTGYSTGYGLAKTGSGTLVLSHSNSYSGGTTVQAGTLQVLSSAATGTAGTVVVDSGGALGVAMTTYTLPAGGLQLNGGTLSTASTQPDTINGSIALTANSQVDVGSTGSLTIPGVISGSGLGLTTGGTGTLILNGNSTYTGSTTVSGGTLEVDGNISASSTVDIDSGGTLGGHGTVGNVVSTGGTVAPADGPNVLTAGGFSLDSNSTFTVQLDGTTPGGATGMTRSSPPARSAWEVSVSARRSAAVTPRRPATSSRSFRTTAARPSTGPSTACSRAP